jgi:hypothetical protein
LVQRSTNVPLSQIFTGEYKALATSLEIEVDTIDRNLWDRMISEFADASIYQTWSLGAAGRRQLSHLIAKERGWVCSGCQVELRTTAFNKIGIADVNWGPMWVGRSGVFSQNVVRNVIRAIKAEYALKRGFLVRIWSHAIGRDKECLLQVLADEGFRRNSTERPYRTLMLDLSPSLPELRRNFLQKWRNHLNKAETHGLKVVEGTGDSLYEQFLVLLREMINRKGFDPLVNYEQYRRVQTDLRGRWRANQRSCIFRDW